MGDMKLNLIRILYEFRHKQSERKKLCERIYFIVILDMKWRKVALMELDGKNEKTNMTKMMKRGML